jgi:hypothetical protein
MHGLPDGKGLGFAKCFLFEVTTVEYLSGKPQITTKEPEYAGSRRDPEERRVSNSEDVQQRSLDKTLADSFPTSDPASSIPDPSGAAQEEIKQQQIEDQLADLPIGTWAALSIENHEVVGTGASREAAVAIARRRGHNILNLVRVDAKSPLGLAS